MEVANDTATYSPAPGGMKDHYSVWSRSFSVDEVGGALEIHTHWLCGDPAWANKLSLESLPMRDWWIRLVPMHRQLGLHV